jgi:NTP pyrophosphatase (non-canonical NTP hydrolase)
MTVQEFQKLIEQIYFDQDAARGVEGTKEEFADVLAWLATLANLLSIDLQEAAVVYANGCPKCQSTPCACQLSAGDSERNSPGS